MAGLVNRLGQLSESGELGARIGTLSGSPIRSKQAGEELQQIRTLRAEEETQAQQIKSTVMAKIMNANIEALKEETDPGRQQVLKNNITQISGALGVDPSSVLGGLGGQEEAFDPTGFKGIATNETILAQAQSGGGVSGLVAKTGSEGAGSNIGRIIEDRKKLKDPADIALFDKLMTAKTTSQRIPGLGEQRLARADENLAKVKAGIAGREDFMSSSVQLAQAHIRVRKALGDLSSAGATAAQQSIEAPLMALAKMDDAQRKIKEILDSDAEAATVAGDLANSFMSMASNMEGLTSLMPRYRAEDVELDIEKNGWRAKMQAFGIKNREMQSIMFSIAIQNAMAEGLIKGRVTNFMLEKSLQIVGAGERNPTALKSRLKEVRTKMMEGLNIAIDMQLGNFSAADAPGVFDAPAELTEEEIARVNASRAARGLPPIQ